MMDETLNDPLKQLEAELDVAPSPEFAAKVRMRLSDADVRRLWPFVVVAAMSLVVVSFVASGRKTTSEWTAPKIASVPVPEPASAPREAEPPSISPRAPRPAPMRVLLSETRPTVKPGEPEVLVLQDQVAGFEQLRARLRDATFDASVLPFTWNERLQASLPRPGEPPVIPESPGAIRLNELVRYGG